MSDTIQAESILKKKASGEVLSNNEIDFIVGGVYKKTLASHQLGALLMAVYIKGMTGEETAYLTKAMMSYGDQFNWETSAAQPKDAKHADNNNWSSRVVDKHSTGGVGDKVSIVLAPMVAACGVKIPMISGRGLGITGGTIDKLESIKGFNPHIALKPRLKEILSNVGCFIIAQSADIAPTDKVMYATRNETGTVASIPLITASIISKKGVEGLKGLVLDVKYGSGGFMKTIEEAEELALSMIEVGNRINIKTIAVLDRMDCPLGFYVGNALEMYECIKILQGELLDSDLMEITFEMGRLMLKLAGIETDPTAGLAKCKESILSGEALKVFKLMLEEQGVKKDLVKKLCAKNITESQMLHLLGFKVSVMEERKAPNKGVVKHIDALKVGLFCQKIGATKTNPTDTLDLACGVHLLKKPGDNVEKDEVWVRVYVNRKESLDWSLLESALEIADSFEKVPLIQKVLE